MEETLKELKARWSLSPDGSPTTELLETTVEHAGKTLTARGALAIAPPRALRMQLVGPAGTLALDVWARDEESRMAMPAVSRVERTGVGLPELPGRPVSFLRWWLLHPFDGVIVRGCSLQRGGLWVRLRAPDHAMVELITNEAHDALELRRDSKLDSDHIVATKPPCGSVDYSSRSSGVHVHVTCEKRGGPPDPKAFEDPDSPAVATPAASAP